MLTIAEIFCYRENCNLDPTTFTQLSVMNLLNLIPCGTEKLYSGELKVIIIKLTMLGLGDGHHPGYVL